MQNFNVAKELAEQSEKDWVFGALSQPGIVSIPQAERAQWLPIGETQFDQFTDFTDCASRWGINALEALFSYHYAHTMLPANRKWLEDKGYVQNGKVTFSDRFIAILSGTTREGNSLKAPLEAIRTQGLIPKALLPKDDTMTWEQYYDASNITPSLKTLGQDFLARFTINYEQVAFVHFEDVLKDDMIGVAGYAWPEPKNGVYPRTEGNFNHAFLIYDLPKYQIFDNYLDYDDVTHQKVPGDFTKILAPNYIFYDYGYRVFISSEIDVALKIWTMKALVQAFLALLGLYKEKTTIPAPIPTPVPETTPEPPQPQPAPVTHPDGYAAGSLDERARMCHLVATICDDMGMSYGLKQDLLLTIAGESGFNQWCINHGTADYGLCQFSALYYLKEYHMTPQEALSQPVKCIRIMAKNFLSGRQSNWVAYATRNSKRNIDMVAKLRAHYLTLNGPVTNPV